MVEEALGTTLDQKRKPPLAWKVVTRHYANFRDQQIACTPEEKKLVQVFRHPVKKVKEKRWY